MPYVTNRAIMSRLDSVFGMGYWKNEFTLVENIGVKCRIYTKVNEEWIFKEDGAEMKPNDNIDPIKSAYSNSQKRCAVQFDIGRYLYSLDKAWVDLKDKGQNYQKVDSNALCIGITHHCHLTHFQRVLNNPTNRNNKRERITLSKQQTVVNLLTNKMRRFLLCKKRISLRNA